MKKSVFRAEYRTPDEVIEESVNESLEIVEEEKQEEPKRRGRKRKDA